MHRWPESLQGYNAQVVLRRLSDAEMGIDLRDHRLGGSHRLIADFVTRYIRGWAENGYDYHAIPLERDAYRLQERYERNPEQSFSVSEEVARRLRGGLEDK